MKANKWPVKKILLTLSLFMILLWAVLGTGTTLAWFADTDKKVDNIFHFADFDLVVEYRDENGVYQDLEGATEVFDDDALYEPGYVQVVYLRVKNNGDVPFKFKLAVRVTDYTKATNYFGQEFLLQEHLRFGLVTAEDETALEALVATREQAEAVANEELDNYFTNYAELAAQDTVYVAIVVRMPWDVDNDANYRFDVIPRVELGIIANASQLNAPDD